MLLRDGLELDLRALDRLDGFGQSLRGDDRRAWPSHGDALAEHVVD
jgi:hypothetical protein